MDEKNRLSDEQMKEAAGGGSGVAPVQHFYPGDKVILRLCPEYGVGIVLDAALIRDIHGFYWEFVVQFGGGFMRVGEPDLIGG